MGLLKSTFTWDIVWLVLVDAEPHGAVAVCPRCLLPD